MRLRFLPVLLAISISFLVHWSCTRTKKAAGGQNNSVKVDDALFREHVRSSDPKTPEEELLSFQLPPGFEVSLYASEPLIGKPINMNFDARGRLWVTQSFEYPFPAEPGKGSDKITILEDRNGDGKAETFTHFADSLNIPIGILPVTGGAIAYSIPFIYQFADKDGDGKAESKKKLIGPFGFKDTHGMVNSLTRGYDGWVHSDHGFANTSRVAGTDGDSITMESGNTFRFLRDGSHVEHTTSGRVNPFGIAFDEWGYMYSSDCHSSPIYQLIKGADYPHFGKAEEGIGFAPAMKPHDDESTALAGLAYYESGEFPKEYQKDFYLGDVIKARIYRNSFSFNGATPVAKREQDFMISADPWFRPVDVKLGPDGALYVADFYNRIIGHYEVPLTHPGRDKIRGRIWRITYKGKISKPADLSIAAVNDLIAALDNKNIAVRMQAADQLVDRVGSSATGELNKLLQSNKPTTSQYIHALWVLERLNALADEQLHAAMAVADPQVKAHALRIIANRKSGGSFFDAVKKSMQDAIPHVRRAAAEASLQFSSVSSVENLLKLENSIDSADSHLRYTTQLSMRNLLRDEKLTRQVADRSWSSAERATLAKVMSGVHNKYAAGYLFQYLKDHATLAKESQMKYLPHVARHLAADESAALVQFTTSRFSEDADAQYKIFNIIQQGLDQAGATAGKEMKDWGVSLAEKYIAGANTGWDYSTQSPGIKRNPLTIENAWDTKIPVIGFDTRGFKGTITSPVFEVPASLKFFIALLDQPSGKDSEASLNEVRLVSAQNNQVLKAEKFARDADYRKLNINWDLAAHKGGKAFLEIVNDPSAGGFLKIGAFEPQVVQLPQRSPQQVANLQLFALQIAGKYEVDRLVPSIKEILQKNNQDGFLKVAAAKALLQIDEKAHASLIQTALQDKNNTEVYKRDLIALLGEFPSAPVVAVLGNSFSLVSKELQSDIVKALVNSPQGIDIVLKRVRSGDVYTRILLEPKIEERINVLASAKQSKEYKELTANLNPANEEKQKLIKDRLAAFKFSPDMAAQGRAVFVQNCAACHQIKKEGGLIGPQLDGIGSWGATALTEKIIDPNQNISEAFRNYTIRMKNGKVVTGLYRREEGQVIVFANMLGEEFRLPKKDIAERTASKYTLMPDHFGEVIPPDQFNTLLSYLLSNK